MFMWSQFFIKTLIFVLGISFLGYKFSKIFKKLNLIWGYRIVLFFTFLIGVMFFKASLKDFVYLNDFKNLPNNHVIQILVNDSIYNGNKEEFINKLKRGDYYFQSHRVQDIRKKWEVVILSNQNEFNLLIEDTYKYGYTIYLIRDENEVTYYKNDNLIEYLY